MHVRFATVAMLIHRAPRILNKWMLHVEPEIPNKVSLTFTRETGMQTEPETYINV
jgi:hypothetical protein